MLSHKKMEVLEWKVAKQEQVSVFIIVGLVILIIISALTYAVNEMKRKDIEKQIGFLPKSALKYHINLCVENTGSFALLKLGMQGDHIHLPGDYLSDSNLNVAYVYHGNYSLASLEQMSEELSKFINNNLKFCVYKYIGSRQRDYELEFGNVTTNTIIAAEDVTFEVNFPVDVIENNSVSRYDSFGATVNVRLSEIRRLIDAVLQKKMESNFDVYHGCFYDPEMNLSVIDYGSSTLFVLEDEGSRFKNIESKSGPYRFLFAVKN